MRIAPESVSGLYEAQKTAVREALARLGAQRGFPASGFDACDLALAFSENQLRGALDWLDSSVGPVIVTAYPSHR